MPARYRSLDPRTYRRYESSGAWSTPCSRPFRGTRIPGSKQKGKRGPKMPRAISYGLRFMTVSALAIAISLGRVEMANAYSQQSDTSQIADNGGKDKADKGKDHNDSKGDSKSSAKADTKASTEVKADSKSSAKAETKANTEVKADAKAKSEETAKTGEKDNSKSGAKAEEKSGAKAKTSESTEANASKKSENKG